MLIGYDPDSYGWDYPEFHNKLYAAEQNHVDKYIDNFSSLVQSHILMINSIDPTNTTREDTVPTYALEEKGVTWVQSNAGACVLKA